MILFAVGDRHFEIVVMSDTDFDGLAWELRELISNEHTKEQASLCQIIRHDDLKKVEFKTSETFSVPLEAFEELLSNFNKTGGRDFMEDTDYES
jgi:hypothetical protein